MRHARIVLLVWLRLRLLLVGLLGWLWSAVELRLRLCCLPSWGWCCVGVWRPLMVGPFCAGAWSPQWWGVLCRCVLLAMVGRAVLAPGAPHGRACFVVVRGPSWWVVLCWCVAHLLLGRAVWCLLAALVVRGVVVLGLGCRLCRLATSVVGFGLVVF